MPSSGAQPGEHAHDQPVVVGEPEQGAEPRPRTPRRRARRSRARAAGAAPRRRRETARGPVSGASPSDSQKAANAGQMLVVRTPPKSTTRARRPICSPAMAEQATDEGSTAPASRDGSRPTSTASSRRSLTSASRAGARTSPTRSPTRRAVAGRCGGRRSGKRLASAHDMGREHRIISALSGTEVPVAHAVGLCEDEAVNGAPFYVMDWVEGPILRSKARGGDLPRRRRAAGDRRAGGRHAGRRSTRSIPTRSGSASWRRRRTTSPASSTAGRASGSARGPAIFRWSTRSTTASRLGSPSRARRRSSTATTGSTT